jgi:cyclophilin family peptidyl-prolyl cis-trans isomerase/HEAT repeat protein
MKKPAALLLIILLCAAGAACGRRPLRPDERERNRLFAEIIKREDRRSLGSDDFFPRHLRDAEQPAVQVWCALALGRIGNPRALPWLYEALQSPSAAVRAAAAFAVGETEDRDLLRNEGRPADPRAAGELRALLDDTALSVRMRAVEALGKIGQDADAIAIARRLEHFRFDGSPQQRAYLGHVLTALMRLRNVAARPVFALLAGIDDPEIQWRVANAIFRMRDQASRPVLERLLRSFQQDVRAHAARALGLCADPALVPVLTPLLSPVDKRSGLPAPLSVRVSALQALANLKSTKALPAIDEALWGPAIHPTSSDRVNFAVQAAATLGNIGAVESVGTLQRLVHWTGPVANSAAVALARLLRKNPERFFTLVEGARFDTPPAARAWAGALGELGGERAEAELKRMLLRATGNQAADADRLAVPAVLQALVRAQASDLQEILRTYLTAHDEVVMSAAVAGFQPTAGAAPWQPLLQAYAAIASQPGLDIKTAILNRLEPWVAIPEVQAFLRTVLRDRARNARIASARLLRPGGARDVPEDAGGSETRMTDINYGRIAASRRDRTIAILDTTRGTIEIELFREDAPLTVANFVSLAQEKFFDGLAFMRVVPYFVIQGGDPRNDQEGGPGYAIRCEINMRPFERGSLGMALSGKDTGGSQFFITLSPQPHLDGGYTCFGRVISGMPAVEQMLAGDRILRVRIEEDITLLDYRRY